MNEKRKMRQQLNEKKQKKQVDYIMKGIIFTLILLAIAFSVIFSFS